MRYWGSENFEIALVRNDAEDIEELQNQEVDEIAARGALEYGYNIAAGGAIGTSRPVTVNKQSYPSMQAVTRKYDIDPTVFALRITRLGWTPDEAAGIVKREKHQRKAIEFRGKNYPSLKNLAESYNKPYKLVHERVKLRGWTLEQSLELVDRPAKERLGKNKRRVIVDGIEYETLSDAARAYKVNPKIVNNRVNKLKWSLKRALGATTAYDETEGIQSSS